MCGIVGYIGGGNVYDILIKGLHRLEYRDMTAPVWRWRPMAVNSNVYKTMGKVSNLEAFCADKKLDDATAGIAHTRWPPMANLPIPMPIRITARTATLPSSTTALLKITRCSRMPSRSMDASFSRKPIPRCLRSL